jgi:hypothetical protein
MFKNGGRVEQLHHEIASVRRMIQDAYLRGELVTVQKLVDWLDEQNISVTHSSLRRAGCI